MGEAVREIKCRIQRHFRHFPSSQPGSEGQTRIQGKARPRAAEQSGGVPGHVETLGAAQAKEGAGQNRWSPCTPGLGSQNK